MNSIFSDRKHNKSIDYWLIGTPFLQTVYARKLRFLKEIVYLLIEPFSRIRDS